MVGKIRRATPTMINLLREILVVFIVSFVEPRMRLASVLCHLHQRTVGVTRHRRRVPHARAANRSPKVQRGCQREISMYSLAKAALVA